jgi:heme exporter protein C
VSPAANRHRTSKIGRPDAISQTRQTLYGKGLRPLSIAAAAALALALALDFFYAPLEAEQGFLQKIFYVHVPLAIIALCGFVLGGILAIQHLRTRDPRWDMRSYVVIHMSLIFAVGTLISGSIWAKGSWGHWWVWSEPTLVSFLIVFLLYATYQPLRFAIEDPERQARYASVFAITAGAFVPMNFLVSLLALALLFATLCKYELTAKHTRAQLRALRRRLTEQDPSLPVTRTRSAAPAPYAAQTAGRPSA